jgi:folate-dependent phosphoribosylglycinamide formyltransferase PurN
MRIAIIGQEEPLFFGPFFREIIEQKPSEMVCVVIVGKRGIGSHPKTFLEKLKNIYSLWLLFEPFPFLKNFILKWIRTIFSTQGNIQRLAKKKQIPILFTNDINSEDFHSQLKIHAPDVIINQSELIIQEKLLSIPKIGIINRHASLLPRFRGRVGSFWGHADKHPEYGVTIHFVDQKIDSGPIIVQQQYNLDPTLSYPEILRTLFKLSVPLILKALQKLEDPNFTPLPNYFDGTPIYGFPTLMQIKDYRKRLKKRRQ